jgi:hypothetical protein
MFIIDQVLQAHRLVTKMRRSALLILLLLLIPLVPKVNASDDEFTIHSHDSVFINDNDEMKVVVDQTLRPFFVFHINITRFQEINWKFEVNTTGTFQVFYMEGHKNVNTLLGPISSLNGLTTFEYETRHSKDTNTREFSGSDDTWEKDKKFTLALYTETTDLMVVKVKFDYSYSIVGITCCGLCVGAIGIFITLIIISVINARIKKKKLEMKMFKDGVPSEKPEKDIKGEGNDQKLNW